MTILMIFGTVSILIEHVLHACRLLNFWRRRTGANKKTPFSSWPKGALDRMPGKKFTSWVAPLSDFGCRHCSMDGKHARKTESVFVVAGAMIVL